MERLRGVVVPTTIQPVDARSGAAKMSSDCEEESDGSTAAIETQSTQMARRWTPWMPRLSLEVIARRARTSEECPAETTSRSGPRAAAEAEGAALDIHDVSLVAMLVARRRPHGVCPPGGGGIGRPETVARSSTRSWGPERGSCVCIRFETRSFEIRFVSAHLSPSVTAGHER